MKRKIALILGVAGALALGWWLVSPLFFSTTVEEELPLSANAVVPDDMTRAEVEQTMSGMAKVNKDMTEDMPEKSEAPAKIKAGTLRDADRFHQGSGQVAIYRLEDGSHVLRLEGIDVTNGPDLHVYLTPNSSPTSKEDVHTTGYANLGKLKGNIGSQNYPLPPEVDVAAQRSVVIYCQPFHVIFSTASLQ